MKQILTLSLGSLLLTTAAFAQGFPPAPEPYASHPYPQETHNPRNYMNARDQYRPTANIDPLTTNAVRVPPTREFTPADDVYVGQPENQEYRNGQAAVPAFSILPDDETPAFEFPKGPHAKRQIAALQVLMSRIGASSGAIDGIVGSNFDKAAAAAGQMTGKFIDPNNPVAIEAALQASGGPAFTSYTITNGDVGQFYVASIPSDYALKAQLPSMAYTSVREMLAERFHIDENYLAELNPGVKFTAPGQVITVPNLLSPKRGMVNYIIADKARKQVRGYDGQGKLVVAYPSTIGSSDTPSPSGTVQVERIAVNPNYTYNPKINFKQGENHGVLIIPPGPNGPVGTVWIALSKPTYGIHGSPEPSRIGKTSSHGCIRLANWDAEELVKLIKPGVTVQFID